MDARGLQEDNNSDEIFSCVARPYRPPSYADFAGIESAFFHKCIDCGDRYILESSLSFHLLRESVVITYFCKQCGKSLNFKNKCTFLGHLREHPVSNRHELTVIVRPLPIFCEEISNEKISKEVNDLKKSLEVVNLPVSPPNGATSPDIKKGFISMTKFVDSPMQFSNSNVKLISTNTKSGEVKVIIRPQPVASSNMLTKRGVCKECWVSVEDIKFHFLGDNKPLNSHLRCSSCDLTLPTKCSLKAHLRTHLKKAPFVCPDCMKEFAFYELFLVHLKYFCFHLDKCSRFSCQACPGVFPTLTSLEVHLAAKHVKPVYKCMACPRAFFEVRLLNEHKLQSHGEAKVATKFFEQCQLCPQKLLTKHCLFLHVHEHVTNKNACVYYYKCAQCGFTSENKPDFASHRLSCSDAQSDLNALAMAKLAKENLQNDVVDDSLPKVKMPLTVCLPKCSSPPTSSSNVCSNPSSKGSSLVNSSESSNVSMLNGKLKNISVPSSASEVIVNVSGNKTLPLTLHSKNQIISLPSEEKCARIIIPRKEYKTCGWHPRKCFICRNESAYGTQKAWQSIPSDYEGCDKWLAGSNLTSCFDKPPKVVNIGSSGRKSFKKNCIALNGPCNPLKSDQVSNVSGTYLCHVCKHSLQIDHRIIRKHFRQQHPDVEVMSLKPLVQKLDFSKSKVPIQRLRFSVNTSKMLKVWVNKNETVSGKTMLKKKAALGRPKQLKSGIKRVDGVMPWIRCKECSFKTKNRKVYNRHLNSHKSARYKCKKCKLEFVSDSSLRIHLIMNHGMDEVEKLGPINGTNVMDEAGSHGSGDDTASENLKCKVCQKSFKLLSDLQKHFRIHGMAFLLLNKDETVWRKV